MYLRAITLGYAVPPGDFNASIHSVFRSAAYLKLEGDWDLLTLVAGSGADLPRGIRVNTPEGFTFEDLQIGEAAICRKGLVSFRNARFEVDLRKARRWDCDLPACNFDGTSPPVRGAWQLVWRALNERQLAYGAQMVAAHLLDPHDVGGSATSRRLAAGISQLLEAAAKVDPSLNTAVSQLIGLGQGVTPTGDDLLVGYIAGLWCATRQHVRRQEYVANFGKTLIALGERTTDLSRSFLYHAALGHVSSRLAGLAEAICNGIDASEVLETAEAAMSVGHTSGMDAVTGLLLGLAAWDRHLLS